MTFNRERKIMESISKLRVNRVGSASAPIHWAAGRTATESFKTGSMNKITKNLVSIGAAVAGKCRPCFACHYKQAQAMGIGDEVIREVVKLRWAAELCPVHTALRPDIAVNMEFIHKH